MGRIQTFTCNCLFTIKEEIFPRRSFFSIFLFPATITFSAYHSVKIIYFFGNNENKHFFFFASASTGKTLIDRGICKFCLKMLAKSSLLFLAGLHCTSFEERCEKFTFVPFKFRYYDLASLQR